MIVIAYVFLVPALSFSVVRLTGTYDFTCINFIISGYCWLLRALLWLPACMLCVFIFPIMTFWLDLITKISSFESLFWVLKYDAFSSADSCVTNSFLLKFKWNNFVYTKTQIKNNLEELLTWVMCPLKINEICLRIKNIELYA